MNWVSNCFRIHRILQTWPLATIIGFLTSRNGCVDDEEQHQRGDMNAGRILFGQTSYDQFKIINFKPSYTGKSAAVTGKLIFVLESQEKLKMFLCPNGQKKSHCMLARRAACSQLRLGDAIGLNAHTTRFNGRNVHTTRHLTARC